MGYFDMERFYQETETSEHRVAIRPWPEVPDDVIQVMPQIYANGQWHDTSGEVVLIDRSDIHQFTEALIHVANFMESRKRREEKGEIFDKIVSRAE